jgi:ATP-binding cassette subfamily F protein uup
VAAAPVAAPAKRKLSYKEQRELDELPGRIEAMEKEQAVLAALLNGSELYSQGAARITEVTARHAQLDEELLLALERWEELGSR